jgi:hypothetical protein
MSAENYVSLWVGVCRSRKSLEDFVKTSFSDDGDFLGSPFSRAFDIGRYDESLLEAEYRKVATASLGELLVGASYEATIVKSFQALATLESPVNCSLLLYDCRHTGRAEWSSPEIALTFVGSVKYR